MPSPLISLVIRCFNEEKHIGNLLAELQKQTIQNYEIIVVDSGSSDATLTIVKNFNVTIISILPEEFTFGYSLNQGCKIARGEYLVFASAHVLPVHSTWLEELIEPFKDEFVAIVYGRQIGNSLTKFSEHQVFMQQFPEDSNFRQKTPFCNNANAAIRKSLWAQYLYDETLSGLEDLAMGKLLIEKGYVIAYNANAAIYHIHEETAKKIFNRYKREAIALKKILPDSHLNIFECIYVWCSTIILDVLRSIKHRVFFKSFSEILMFRTMQYWGMYLGINSRTPLTHEMIMRFYYPRNPKRYKKNWT